MRPHGVFLRYYFRVVIAASPRVHEGAACDCFREGSVCVLSTKKLEPPAGCSRERRRLNRSVSRALFLSDAVPSRNLCRRSVGVVGYRHLVGSAFFREGRVFILIPGRRAGAVHSARLSVLHEVNNGNRRAGGALIRNRTWIPRVTQKRCIEINLLKCFEKVFLRGLCSSCFSLFLSMLLHRLHANAR